MFHTYVACVLFGCWVWLKWFSSVFFSNVSEACFKCFNCLQTYVATVVFNVFYLDVGYGCNGFQVFFF
jgi:hypothetical protein